MVQYRHCNLPFDPQADRGRACRYNLGMLDAIDRDALVRLTGRPAGDFMSRAGLEHLRVNHPASIVLGCCPSASGLGCEVGPHVPCYCDGDGKKVGA